MGVDSAVVADLDDPPGFVQLVANPLRWRLLRELVRSDRAVRELTERLDAPQNLVSYHLRQLRDGGLVQARRSTADGRDTYYAIDLASCEQQLRAVGGRCIPRSSPPPPADTRTRRGGGGEVLFLCTGNSARSQMAEALLEHMSGGGVETDSAGSHPKTLHPNAIRVMRTRGIDISGNRTKHLDEFVSQRFDLVITLCDRVRESVPIPVASHPRALEHAGPRTGGPDRPGVVPGVRAHRRELETRIRFLVPTLTSDPPAPRRGGPRMSNDEMVSVRYMVDDVDEAVAFYTNVLDFEVITRPGPPFADVKRGNLRLLLSGRPALPAGPCPMAPSPDPAAGTGYTSSSTTSTPRSPACATPARGSATNRRRTRRQADPAPRPVGQRRRAIPTGEPIANWSPHRSATGWRTDRGLTSLREGVLGDHSLQCGFAEPQPAAAVNIRPRAFSSGANDIIPIGLSTSS